MELEKQFLEVDRLSVENSALSEVAFSDDEVSHPLDLRQMTIERD